MARPLFGMSAIGRLHWSRDGSRATATYKMECFVIIVTGFDPLTVITKRSILDVAAALDPPLKKKDLYAGFSCMLNILRIACTVKKTTGTFFKSYTKYYFSIKSVTGDDICLNWSSSKQNSWFLCNSKHFNQSYYDAILILFFSIKLNLSTNEIKNQSEGYLKAIHRLSETLLTLSET